MRRVFGVVALTLTLGLGACRGGGVSAPRAEEPAALGDARPSVDEASPPPGSSGERPWREEVRDQAAVAAGGRGLFGFAPIDVDKRSQLIFDGVGPASQQVLDSIDPFLRTRSAGLATFHARRRELMVFTRFSDRKQLHRVRAPLGAREQLTFGDWNLSRASYDPTDPQSMLLLGDFGGTEEYSLVRLHLPSGTTTLLSREGEHVTGFLPNRAHGLIYSVFSDGGLSTNLELIGPGKERTRILHKPGSWRAGSRSPDGRKLLVGSYAGVDSQMLHVLDIRRQTLRSLDAPERKSVLSAGLFMDDERLLVKGRRGGDFKSLFEYNLRRRTVRELTPGLDWDVESMTIEPGTGQIAFTLNVDGYSVLHRVTRSGVQRVSETGGVVTKLRFSRRGELIAALSRSRDPADVVAYDLRSGERTDWTHSETGGLSTDQFVEPELIRVRSFDGLEIPAFYYRPKGRGPFATVINAHGGPESQFRPSFNSIVQYFVSRGIAVVAPNIRGSSGYGARYLSLDDRTRRMDAIKDIGALLDWIEERPELAPDRIGIAGGSYGGFVSTASLVEYPDRIAAGLTMVGVADLAVFLENTSAYRQDRRRQEYGDERDAEERAWMDRISPVRRAGNIRAPLMVIHGMNDPRVPIEVADRLVAAVRQSGGEAWYITVRDEGHSIHSKPARNEVARRAATFFERFLLAPETMPPLQPRRAAESSAGGPGGFF